MGALDDAIAAQRASAEETAAALPYSGGYSHFSPKADPYSKMNLPEMADDFCSKLKPDDGERAALILHDGQDLLFELLPELKAEGFGSHSGESVKYRRERNHWLRSNDRGGGRLIMLHYWDTSLQFGRIGGRWSAVSEGGYAIWGGLDSPKLMAQWLIEHGRA